MMVSEIIYLHIDNNIMCPSENYYLCAGMMHRLYVYYIFLLFN